MNSLLIVLRTDGRWVARVSNVEIEYFFRYLPEEPDFGTLCVQSLAMAMKGGREQVVESIANNGIFELGAGMEPQEMVGVLFDTTNTLFFNDAILPIFTAEETIAGALDVAGTCLLDALV